MSVNSLRKTVTRQRRGCYLNPGPTAPESSTLTTRLPSHTGPYVDQGFSYGKITAAQDFFPPPFLFLLPPLLSLVPFLPSLSPLSSLFPFSSLPKIQPGGLGSTVSSPRQMYSLELHKLELELNTLFRTAR